MQRFNVHEEHAYHCQSACVLAVLACIAPATAHHSAVQFDFTKQVPTPGR